ncbi:Compactin diketide synthase mlcB [Paramyrothecium foliicola]|nr:Compactin diketide synthase mlcB [Paramyrothecium foliicola]
MNKRKRGPLPVLGCLFFLAKTSLYHPSSRALPLVTSEHLEKLPTFLRKYTASLRHQRETDSFSKYPSLDDGAFQSLLVECETNKTIPSFIPVVAGNLKAVLLGEATPTQLLSSTYTDTSSALFQVSGSLLQDGRLSHFLDLASHEDPGIKLLWIGGGNGAVTRQILHTLQAFEAETSQAQFSTYTFADGVPAAFNELRKEFIQWQDRMFFKLLDLEHDPIGQGFEAFSFDLIVAAHTSHTARSLKKVLSHLRGLLRTGGRLVLVEATSPESALLSVGFGCLEDWWIAEEPERQHGPIVTESRWDVLMREAGFSGTDLIVRDHENSAAYYSSIMVTTALDVVGTESNSTGDSLGRVISDQTELFVLIDASCGIQASLAAALAAKYPAAKVMDMTHGIEQGWTTSRSAIVVSLLEVEKAYVADLSEADFATLKNVLQKAQQALWVASAPHSHNHTTDPRYLVATGLLRTVRSEDPDKHLVMLNVEPSDHDRRLRFVIQVLQSCFLDQNPSAEAEFVARDGHLNIARMIREEQLDGERLDRIRPRLQNEKWQTGPPLALDIAAPGLLDSLRFKEDLIYQTELGPDEVEIKAEAWPVAFRDIFIALGRLGREELGIECAGRVSRLGSACTSLQVGDRVVMVTPGCMRSHPRSSSEKVMKIPDELSIFEAVSVLNPGLTAYHALTTIARLQPGEKILIHSAAGSTGQFACGIAKMIGAEIFATVGYDSKKELLMDRFGIPEDHIFWSRNTSFAKGIKRITNGNGVDVVLNSLSGDGLTASWECIAPFGRFVEIGKADIGANTPLPMGSFAKNVSFSAVDLFHISQTNFRLLRQLMSQVLELATRDGFLGNPRPLHVYQTSEVEKAFRYMQSGKNTGRIIISVEDAEVVPKFITHQTSWRFAENASYLVVGGLGGLGRPIIRWMASRGARNLILPSRSGAVSKVAIEVVKELEDKGVRVLTPRCDVSSATDFAAMLSKLANASPAVPPVKGCINSAMDLQDSVFENMTYSQWHRTIQSKVKTSWNLHELLPDLDFFIMLASIVGIYGSAGQSNYAAGCAFQDAPARYRTESGHHTSVSLDLGWMRDDGVIRESADLQRRFTTATDLKPVATADLLALLDHYCDPALPPLTPDQSQVLVGISTPSEVRAQGRDDSWARRTRLYAGFDVTQAIGVSVPGQALSGEDAAQLFRQADTADERAKVVSTALREKLAKAMGIAIDEIDVGKGLADYGVDSLMAVELRNWIRRDFGVSLAVFEIMDGGRKVQDMGALVESKAEK